MRKAFLAAVFIFASVATFAQAPQASAQVNDKVLIQRAADITNGMVKHLRLTPEQAQRVSEINLTSMRQAEQAKVKFKKNPKKTAAQMQIISETRLSLIKDVLTPQQFTQYQQRREEKMGVPKEMQSNPASRQEGSRYNEQYNN